MLRAAAKPLACETRNASCVFLGLADHPLGAPVVQLDLQPLSASTLIYIHLARLCFETRSRDPLILLRQVEPQIVSGLAP